MTNTKRCELCRNSFETLNEQDHCKRCSRIRGVQRFFDTDAESLINAIEKYPELPITNSVEWRQRELPERRYFLYPIIPEASITFVAGEDGSGKTMFCMGIADALAKGKNFAPWKNRAENPIKCLYFEGKRQFNPIFTKPACRGMMLPKTKEATSWTNYPEPSSLNKNVPTGNNTSTAGKRRG